MCTEWAFHQSSFKKNHYLGQPPILTLLVTGDEMKPMKSLCIALTVVACSTFAPIAGAVPNVGREAAREFMKKSNYPERVTASEASSGIGPSDHFVGLQVGRFLNSEAYEWAQKEKAENVGKTNFALTYLVSQYYSGFDLSMRLEATNYQIREWDTQKLSFLAAMSFPEVQTQFPLYFGAALGPAVFSRQVPDESVLALDYQLYMGLRFFDVWDSVGLNFEGGIKNHVHLLTNGQLNGNFLALGTVFLF